MTHTFSMQPEYILKNEIGPLCLSCTTLKAFAHKLLLNAWYIQRSLRMSGEGKIFTIASINFCTPTFL